MTAAAATGAAEVEGDEALASAVITEYQQDDKCKRDSH